MDFLQQLEKLALLKGKAVDSGTLSLYSADLTKNFSPEQLKFALNYFMRRSKWFPDLSDFYDLLAPVKDPESLAIEACCNYTEKAFSKVERESYSALEVKLFDIVSPNTLREATSYNLLQHQKTLRQYLTDHFRQPENKMLQHRKTIEESQGKLEVLKKLLTN